ncbi:LuxR C-terminal-related transcriptional regulator [Streptomyces sp. NBC_01485]|uniref:helix-turn-helix transcriptional regulator n=1 Tax=Streptomyces sp. NBC_01485 TaxID=2903884 RepID=UPI002E30B2DB|nr:LuxR C-terminal-related transcriptional regulator [Streptomyces sp. NBC_01485]
MTVPLTPQQPIETRLLARSLADFRTHSRMDMALGGRVLPGAGALEITELCGARTRSAAGLRVRAGAGLGGKALMLARPVSVSSYLSAEGISHIYDHAVRPEALETIAVLPIVVDRVPRLVVYLATRAQVGLGDRWFDSFTPLVRRLERDIAVDDEVRRRLALMRTQAVAPDPPALSQADLRDIARELAELAGQIEDDALRARVEAVHRRFTPAAGLSTLAVPAMLRPREIDVLQKVAEGLGNREIAQALGLLPNTVKSYLKTAMRKLHARNRVQAILVARESGLIR